MPPRAAGSRGQRPPRGGGDRGGGRGDRGRGRGRGAPAPRGGMQGADSGPVGQLSIAANVTAVGVKRPGFGTAGRVIKVRMNSFEATVANDVLYQYDGKVSPSEILTLLTLANPSLIHMSTPDDLSKKFRLRLMDKLQEDKPGLFPSPVMYDGKAIMFSKHKLALADPEAKKPVESKQFDIVVDPPRGNKPPKVYNLKITQAKEGQTVNLHSSLAVLTWDTSVQMAEMALNISMRMVPQKKYASNARSFFTTDGRLLVNVDVSSAVFYSAGPLHFVCMDFLGLPQAELNRPAQAFSPANKKKLESFLRTVKVVTRHTGHAKTHAVQGLGQPASVTFNHEQWGKITVANYFKRQYNVNLRSIAFPCVKTGRESLIPMELCEVLPGQFCKSQLDPEQTKRMVEFSTMKPPARFQAIHQQGLQMLDYGQSEYVRQCGIVVNPQFIEVDARILPEPVIKCFPDRDPRKAEFTPGGGKWNMLNRKYYRPARITGFMVVIFESERRFGEPMYKEMVKSFVGAAKDFGLVIEDPVPYVKWVMNRANVHETLIQCGRAYFQDKKQGHPGPSLILAVLPPSSKDLYNAVKRFGFIGRGIATQCLLSSKCGRAAHQYWANIMLKVNVKLDGTNFVPLLKIIDPAKPTIVFGADAVHPPPGAGDKPSFTALASSVDSMLAKYIASNGIQGGGREMIHDLQAMSKNALEKWQQYQGAVEKKRAPPVRLFYIRDGVSVGEFEQVIDKELPKIKAACQEMRCNPKITVIIVVKRHHHRGVPVDPRDADQSGNIPAGSTIDTGITHPVEHDYIQYSHGGILGTSRPARYTALYDENDMSPNAIQELTYGLAHSLPRATRSVSIPAPVYHAHIICEKRAITLRPYG
ncbi:Piwi-domain-containing protein [Coprinellus micaceus]|uniref:Piwi-domain-containing protein n=1 Tax=Coprinellus micaceus TaxID=71717 RepID=A0A4Y7TDG6_COPMI|nr:Piwi-domain-containing protein [Coprinellus micaceus]